MLSGVELISLNFKSVGKNVFISDKASIYNARNISIGDNVRIDDFCILSAGEGGIELGNYVHIACYASIIGKGKITMCDYSGLSSRVSVYSSTDSYDGDYMTNPCLPKGVTNTQHKDVYIGKHVVIGTGSAIMPGVTLKDGCCVWCMSVVTKSFSENTIVAGITAKKRGERKLNIYELEKKLK